MTFIIAVAALQPTAPTISAVAVPPASVTLSIVTPSTEPVTGIGFYLLEQLVGGVWQNIQTIPVAQFPYTYDTGLGTSGGTVVFRLLGVDNGAQKDLSPPSNQVSITFQGQSQVPGQPGQPSFTNTTSISTTASWAPSNNSPTGYEISCVVTGNPVSWVNNGFNTSRIVNGLASVTNYTFSVRGYNSIGKGQVNSNTFTTASSGGGGGGITFPALGSCNIGSPQNYDNATVQQRMALEDICIVGFYPGWEAGRSMNASQVCSAVHAASVRSTQIFAYFDPIRIADYTQYPAYMGQINGSNWYARASWPNGAPRQLNSSNATYVFVGGPTGVGGRTCTQYLGDYTVDWMVNGGAAGLSSSDSSNVANPNLDGAYEDDLQVSISSLGPVQLSNLSSASDANLRAGQLAILQEMQAKVPGFKVVGNVAAFQNQGTITTEYNGQLSGGAIEGVIGETWSIESFGTGAASLAGYQKAMATFNSDKLGVFFHIIQANGTDIGTQGGSTPYQAARHGICECLMDNGRYFPSANDNYSPTTNVAIWFDEFCINRATQKPVSQAQAAASGYMGWLGTAVDLPQTAPWQNGVYRREFHNGFVFWNPKENAAQTINFGTTLYFIQGNQAPGVNKGGSGMTAPIGRRDGLIMLKSGSGGGGGGTGYLTGAYVQNSYQGVQINNLGINEDELRGTDSVTGFVQPSPGAVWGGTPGYFNRIQKIQNADTDFTPSIQTGAQLPAGILPGSGRTENFYRVTMNAPYDPSITSQVQNIHWPDTSNSLNKMYYIRQWVRFDAQVISKMNGNGNFLALSENKTGSTYRTGIGIHSEGSTLGGQVSGTPNWYISADQAQGGQPYKMFWQLDFNINNFSVLQGTWFLLEFASFPSANAGLGWVWAAINGKVLTNGAVLNQTYAVYSPPPYNIPFTVTNSGIMGATRPADEPINRIFYNMAYTSATRPFTIDIARAELWTFFPADASTPHP